MNKNYAIGLLVAVIVIGGIAYLVSNRGGNPGDMASSTPVNVVDNSTPSSSPQQSQPSVTTAPVVALSDTTAVVTGSVVPNGAFTSYWYEYGTTPNLGSKTSDQNLGSGFGKIQASAFISGLTKNTTYYFRLVAENRFGKVSGEQLTFKTTVGTPAPVGGVPSATTLLTTNVTASSANVLGDVTANKVPTIYWFEYGKTTDLGNVTSFATLDNAGAIKTSVGLTLSNLDSGTTYYYRLDAQNQFGTVNGSIKSFVTLGPVAATAPTVATNNASGMDTSGVSLFGTVNPNGAETTYWFEYSVNSHFATSSISRTNGITLAASKSVSSVREDLTSLNSKTTYYFRLVAQNNLGTVQGSVRTFRTK